MQLIVFFVTWLLFLLASSITITAFFSITRGYTEVLPDGTEHRYGKILKGYYFFWFRQTGKKQLFYTGDQLAELLYRMQPYYHGPVSLVGDPLAPATITKFEAGADFLKAVPLLRSKLQVHFTISGQGSDKLQVSAFEEDPQYAFPGWLRTVMAGCITCTPTVYGNIIFWGAVLLVKDSILYNSLFGCFSSFEAGIVFVWLTYWLSLAWLNTVLFKIFEK